MALSANDRPPAPGARVDVLFLQMIPMRDGARLAANVFLPKDRTVAAPAIVEFTPYSRDTGSPEGVRFASEGFAFVSVDCRGRGDSEGIFLGHHAGEADDGHDLVEWVAAQPWCSGDVALFGGSYTGQNQWTTAAAHPPHLRTIIPAVASMGGLAPGAGGIPIDHQFNWGMLTAGKSLSQRLVAEAAMHVARLVEAFEAHESFRSLNARLGGPWGLPDEMNTTPQFAPWRPEWGPAVDGLPGIDVPVLEITGPYDLAVRGALEHHRRYCRARPADQRPHHHLVLGPWEHGAALSGRPQAGDLVFGPAADVDLMQVAIDWYRWVMGDGEKPPFLDAPVRYYVTGAEEWRSAPDLDAATTATMPWYLVGHDGRHSAAHPGWLRPEPADSPSFRFVCDPDERTTMLLEQQPSPAGQSHNPLMDLPPSYHDLGAHLMGVDPTSPVFVASIDGFGAVYTSARLSEPLELVGEPQLDAWVVLDQPDADLCALLYELRVDGSRILLSPAVQRLRHRDPARGVQLMVPGEATLVSFRNFHWFARRLAAGSRLQLAVRHTGSLRMDRNHHTGRPDGFETPDDVRVANVEVLHSGEHRSVLHLPIGRASER
jgi:putative CocE/NonD family hydrolase